MNSAHVTSLLAGSTRDLPSGPTTANIGRCLTDRRPPLAGRVGAAAERDRTALGTGSLPLGQGYSRHPRRSRWMWLPVDRPWGHGWSVRVRSSRPRKAAGAEPSRTPARNASNPLREENRALSPEER